MLAVVALVALRLGVGWQFYREGVEKVQDGFSSAGFLGAAQGPLSGMYTGLLPDPDGLSRLDKEKTIEAWKRFNERAIRHYHFGDDSKEMAQRDELEKKLAAAKATVTKEEISKEIHDLNRTIEAIRNQDEAAKELLSKQIEMLEAYFAANEADIEQYKKGLERRKSNQRPGITEVESLRGQADKIEADLRKERAEVIGGIDALWDAYEEAITQLATNDQIDEFGRLSLPRPGEKLVGASFVDKVIPWFDLTVGVLLILGLFTRVAATVGGLFVLSVVLSQWPGAAGAKDVYYEVNLMLAMFVLAAVGAGRFCGLDYFGSLLMGGCCRSRTQTANQE